MYKTLFRTCLLMLVLVLTVSALSGCAKPAAGTEESSPDETEMIPTAETEATAESEPSTEAIPASEPTPTTEAAPSTEEEPITEATPTTEPVTTSETEPTTSAPILTIDDLAFIGDSRTLTMATGGRYEFGLIPSTSVFATWGGELTQDSAKENALAAAAADRKLAIFWYGINDVQSDPEQKLASQFRTNYEAIIDLYRTNNPDSDIAILSILSTSVHEKDYYAGQEENIRTYNTELAALCAEDGYIYLDITGLFTGDECLAAEDYIHFSKEWYEEKFLPTVLRTLGIIS